MYWLWVVAGVLLLIVALLLLLYALNYKSGPPVKKVRGISRISPTLPGPQRASSPAKPAGHVAASDVPADPMPSSLAASEGTTFALSPASKGEGNVVVRVVKKIVEVLTWPFRRKKKPSFPNNPPTVTLSASLSRVVPAPECLSNQRPVTSCTPTASLVRLSAETKDPDGDTPFYTYSTTGGRVIGDGPNATLDLTGVATGTYMVTVEAKTRNGTAFSSKTVEVAPCECKDIPPPPVACPIVRASCPDIATAGSPVTFTANVSDGDPNIAPTYNWAVSAGTISSGQGTRSITVSTADVTGTITATVDVGGYDRSCSTSDSCTVSFPSAPVQLISGVVRNKSGLAVPNAKILVFRDGVLIDTLRADGGGYYARSYPPGDYQVRAIAPDGTRGDLVNVHPGDTITLTVDTAATTPTLGTPPGTSPSPTPTPVASPTPEEADATKYKDEDEVTVVYPQRFMDDKPQEVSCKLATVKHEVVPTTTVEHGEVRSINPVEIVPGKTINKAQGPQYKAFGTFRIVSDDLEVVPREGAEKPLEGILVEPVTWTFQVRPLPGVGSEASFTVLLDVVWRADGEKEIRKSVRLDDPYTIHIGPPRKLIYSSAAAGGGGVTSIFLGVAGGKRRRRREDEVADDLPSPAPPPPAPVAEQPSAAEPGATQALSDEVHCTVFAPMQRAPGDRFIVHVFAHLVEEADELGERAAMADPQSTERDSVELDEEIAQGEKLFFYLEMPPFVVSEPMLSLKWKGKRASVKFDVLVPADCTPGTVNGKVHVFYRSSPVGRLIFNFAVVERGAQMPAAPADEGARHTDFVRFKYAFISYASEDRPEVLRRVQVFQYVKIDFFLDLLKLDPGVRWERQLYKEIDKCDAFFLFWSKAAKDSLYVTKEVEYALKRRAGKDDAPPEIYPVVIGEPPPEKPPDTLKDLHFNDRLIYFICVEDALRAARQSEGPTSPATPAP